MAGDDEGLGIEGVQVASRGSVLTWAHGLNQELCGTGSSVRD
jgi:hypothetical protein